MNKGIKYGGLVLSIIGAAFGIAADVMSEKQTKEEILEELRKEAADKEDE